MTDHLAGADGAVQRTIGDKATIDAKALAADAQALLHAAADLTGERADAMRQRGTALLGEARERAQQVQGRVTERGQRLKEGADQYVRGHPWRTVATAAGVGLLLGLLLGRQ